MTILNRRALAGAAGALACVAAARRRPSRSCSTPANYAQNVLTAARELQQINNQILAAEPGPELVNQARNLASLPTSTLDLLQSDLARTSSCSPEAQHITYNTGQINCLPDPVRPGQPDHGSNAQLVARAQQRWQTSLGAFQDALERPGRRRRQSHQRRPRCRRW